MIKCIFISIKILLRTQDEEEEEKRVPAVVISLLLLWTNKHINKEKGD
jgi:hypothetical protein